MTTGTGNASDRSPVEGVAVGALPLHPGYDAAEEVMPWTDRRGRHVNDAARLKSS